MLFPFARGLLTTAVAFTALLTSWQAYSQTCATPNTDADFILGTAQGLDGVAMNVNSGLVWQRCVEGQAWGAGTCSGVASLLNWNAYAEGQQRLPKSFADQTLFGISAGFTQNLLESGAWRMPYQRELATLANGCSGGGGLAVVNGNVFPAAPAAQTWTATLDVSVARAIQVNFLNGGASSRDRSNLTALRLVRGGQPFAAVPARVDLQGNPGATMVVATFPLATATGAGESWGGVRIAGAGSGEFQVNGTGPWLTQAIVRSTDVLTVRMTAAAAAGTELLATLELLSAETTSDVWNVSPDSVLRRRSVSELRLMAAVTPVTTAIPTLSQWGTMLMASLLGVIAFLRLRRQH